MIGRVRRWRLLALLLLLATPGVAGTVLEGVHPCPETAPASAAAEMGHGAHGGEQESPAHSGECHCLGACIGAVATITFAPAVPTVAIQVVATAAVRPSTAALPAFRPSDRLPPSTAPPLG
jgi:hypothetical protein